MAVAKRTGQKDSPRVRAVSRKEPQPRLKGQELRRALEELRDTKSESRAEELKKVISYSICGA
jgi:hypothetical protein